MWSRGGITVATNRKLDKAQRAAVDHINGPFLCIAGPGSGKTTVIVNRVKNLIEHGIQPDSILTVTFSKAAALEMNKRYHDLPGSVDGPTFCTIHSFAFAVLRYVYGFTMQNIMDETKQSRFIVEEIKNEEIKVKRLIDKKKMVQNVIRDLSFYRCTECSDTFEPGAFRKFEDFKAFYERYVSFKKENRLIDYDDMLYLCRDVFKNRKDILKLYHDHYRYIMIDEFQDTSAVQAEIMYGLAEPENNIFICGDDDQSIYKFRGARPDIMLDFPKQYPECGISKLVTNYRSDSDIIDGAKKLIQHNKIRFDKDITGKKAEPGIIQRVESFDSEDSYNKLLNMVRDEIKITPINEIAVLCRTNKEVSAVAKLFSDNNIPFYCTVSVENFHDSFIFKTMMKYLRVAYGDDSWETIKEIINKPFRYVSKADIEKAKSLGDLLSSSKWSTRKGATAISNIMFSSRRYAKKCTSIDQTMKFILKTVDLTTYISSTCDYLFLDESEQLDIIKQACDEMKKFKTLEDYERYVKTEDENFKKKLKEAAAGNAKAVAISTLHKAKGLEYECVFIPSCNYGNIPYCRSEELEDESAEEERRLFYVGITRAKSKCYIIHQTSEKESNYLTEIFPDYKKEDLEDDCCADIGEEEDSCFDNAAKNAENSKIILLSEKADLPRTKQYTKSAKRRR